MSLMRCVAMLLGCRFLAAYYWLLKACSQPTLPTEPTPTPNTCICQIGPMGRWAV